MGWGHQSRPQLSTGVLDNRLQLAELGETMDVNLVDWRAPILSPGEFHGQKSLAVCSPWGCKNSGTTEAA